MNNTYAEFLSRKSQLGGMEGFEPLWLPDYLFGFQRYADEWAIRRGRAGVFFGCGMGKTPIYFVWAENVVRHTNRPVLVATTLGDSEQAVRDAARFQVDAVRSKDGKFRPGARVVVTNYERLHLFDPADFSGMAANESSILKNFKGKRKAVVTEFMRTLPYRLLTTATAAPNDYIELGTSSEALGELGHQDMLTRFFTKQLAARGTIGWGREKYRMKGHAERDFWRWVCSWSRAARRPSDLGFPDDGFALPELVIRDHVVAAAKSRADLLFDLPALTMQEQEDELRRTVKERCEKAAELLTHKRPAIAWCNRNAESSLLAKLIPGAVEVSGADSDDEKEEAIDAFIKGQIRCMVTKSAIAGFGLNLQHCAHMTVFPTHSWERWHQLIRRCWRFGQQEIVRVDTVTTPGLADVTDNLNAKEEKVQTMLDRMIGNMNDALTVHRPSESTLKEAIPAWLS